MTKKAFVAILSAVAPSLYSQGFILPDSTSNRNDQHLISSPIRLPSQLPSKTGLSARILTLTIPEHDEKRCDKQPEIVNFFKQESQTIFPHIIEQLSSLTDVTSLRNRFGSNRNKLWGDLDKTNARQLYHSILPSNLLELHQQGLSPQVLAPIAFEARKAAKQYVRERSQVPSRIFATMYDGVRHLKKYGSWSSKGMSWNEIWNKYEEQIMLELEQSNQDVSEVDLSWLVSLRILERSCVTNRNIDMYALRGVQ